MVDKNASNASQWAESSPGGAARLSNNLKSLFSRTYEQGAILQLANFLRSHPSPILICDPDGGVIKINPAAERLLRRLRLSDPTCLLPFNHTRIIQDCLDNSQQDYSVEVKLEEAVFGLTYQGLANLGMVSIYIMDLTEYRQAEHHLLRAVGATLGLARLAIARVRAYRDLAMTHLDSAASTPTPGLFVAMDGSVFTDTQYSSDPDGVC